jgi:uncharacterized membrane protein
LFCASGSAKLRRMIVLGLLQWRPHLEPIWCGVVIVLAGLWVVWIYRRLLRRVPPANARLLLLPKLLLLVLLLTALFNPVSALEKREAAKGKALALVDISSSMDTTDDYRESRLARARKILADWQRNLPAGISLDGLDFDTAIRKPSSTVPGPGLRGTDLGASLLALAERPDVSSYLAVALLTDGGDEPVESAALPPVPLSVVGIGTDPATWNDVAIADLQHPATVEKDLDFEISADLVAHAGAGRGFAPNLSQVGVRVEHQAGAAWEKVADQKLDLSHHQARAKFAVKSQATGSQRYRVVVDPVNGELSTLNNSRTFSVEVRKRALHVLYFTRELGQEFKMLRNEIAHDPGMTFTALFRTVGERFTLQGDRFSGDAVLEAGFPATKEKLDLYDCIIIGSFPAEDCTPAQREALVQYVDGGGSLVFLGGDKSFGRGGYANTALAPLFPWRIADSEPEPASGIFPVDVPPVATGHPIMATVEDLVVRAGATIESVNQLTELKPGATALLNARLGGRNFAVIALQPYGKGKVLGVASNTLWKWATQAEALRTAYGLFWRQALRNLTGKAEGGQNLVVKWDKEYYRPGEQARAEVRVVGLQNTESLRFAASLSTPQQSVPVPIDLAPGQANTFSARLLFRERGEFAFQLVAYQGDRVLETYEKTFSVAPLAAEGSRLELDEVFLKKLAERGGGRYLREDEAGQFVQQFAGKLARKSVITESPLVEAGAWYASAFLLVLLSEWILRRRAGLF